MELPIVQRLKKELDELKAELHGTLPKALEEARAHGDLRENAEYHACKERQGFINARIGQIHQRMSELSIFTVESIPHDLVGYGSRVTLEDVDNGETQVLDIVFPEEVNASAGRISLGSPIGKAVLRKSVGDEVTVQAPNGRRTFEILDLCTWHDRGDGK